MPRLRFGDIGVLARQQAVIEVALLKTSSLADAEIARGWDVSKRAVSDARRLLESRGAIQPAPYRLTKRGTYLDVRRIAGRRTPNKIHE